MRRILYILYQVQAVFQMNALPLAMGAVVALAATACQKPHNSDINPTDVVSTSLCADSYLLAMPDIAPRLAALSWQSRSALSRAPAELRDLPQAGTDRETLMGWRPAQIITGPGAIPLASSAKHLNWTESFEGVWDNFAALSNALGSSDPSPDLQNRLGNIPAPSRPLRALYLDRSGASAGPDTFVDAVFQAAGVTNILTQPGWQTLDTETLISLAPDVIVTSFMGSDYHGANDRVVRQDALAQKIANTPQIDIPGAFWPCAGPGLVDAAEAISKELATL